MLLILDQILLLYCRTVWNCCSVFGWSIPFVHRFSVFLIINCWPIRVICNVPGCPNDSVFYLYLRTLGLKDRSRIISKAWPPSSFSLSYFSTEVAQSWAVRSNPRFSTETLSDSLLSKSSTYAIFVIDNISCDPSTEIYLYNSIFQLVVIFTWYTTKGLFKVQVYTDH